MHGERLADLPMPKPVRDELVASGRAAPHQVLPESGWVSAWIHGADDVPSIVSLFCMQYERATRAVASNGPEAGENV